MNLRLRNPLHGSMEPWPLATRLVRFALTAIALLFLNISSRTLRSVVVHNTGLREPEALPERPRRIAEWLCHISTALLFFGIWSGFSGNGGRAVGLIVLAVVVCAVAGRYLLRTAWGLRQVFQRPPGRLGEALRRLGRVIRHGLP